MKIDIILTIGSFISKQNIDPQKPMDFLVINKVTKT